MKNYYQILQVDKNANSEVIKKIFNYHIKKNHPDLYKGSEIELAKERTQAFNEAYAVLSNPEKRKQYDMEIEENTQKEKNDNLVNIDRLLKENEYLREQVYEKEKVIDNICKNINVNKNYFFPQEESELTNKFSNHVDYEDIKQEPINTGFFDKKRIKELATKIALATILIVVGVAVLSVFTNINIFKLFYNSFFR
ncbi:MAG: DnaJ domain-containing protein [Clostridia bacterium]|nr:DnaJ domain-containing protein [Clostridia bacterium]